MAFRWPSGAPSAGSRTRFPLILGALLKVRLFGSYARNDFDALSDVDVLVVVESLSPAGRNRIIDRAVESSTSEVILAPLILTAAELDALRARGMLIAQDIDREGIDV